MSIEKAYFTKKGMDILEGSFSSHEDKVKKLYRDLGEACRDDPDLPENLVSKEIRAKFQTEIPNERARLLGMKAAAILVETSPEFLSSPEDTIWIGSEVEYVELATKEKSTIQIMGLMEEDFENDIVSYKAPIAQAMLGKKTGDTFRISGIDGDYLILSVHRVLLPED